MIRNDKSTAGNGVVVGSSMPPHIQLLVATNHKGAPPPVSALKTRCTGL